MSKTTDRQLTLTNSEKTKRRVNPNKIKEKGQKRGKNSKNGGIPYWLRGKTAFYRSKMRKGVNPYAE